MCSRRVCVRVPTVQFEESARASASARTGRYERKSVYARETERPFTHLLRRVSYCFICGFHYEMKKREVSRKKEECTFRRNHVSDRVESYFLNDIV